jgi:hypothetical protein
VTWSFFLSWWGTSFSWELYWYILILLHMVSLSLSFYMVYHPSRLLLSPVG